MARSPRSPRRVVTGHTADGKSVFLSEGTPPVSAKVPDGGGWFEIWETSRMPVPIAAAEPEPTSRPIITRPPRNGTIVRVCEALPGSVSPIHRTASVDYAIVIAGTLTLVLDDDAAVELHPGDVAVQRGTDHRWENRTNAPVRVAFVLVDAYFTDELAARLPADLESTSARRRAEDLPAEPDTTARPDHLLTEIKA